MSDHLKTGPMAAASAVALVLQGIGRAGGRTRRTPTADGDHQIRRVDATLATPAQLAEAKQELANILWPMTLALWRTISADLRDRAVRAAEPDQGRA